MPVVLLALSLAVAQPPVPLVPAFDGRRSPGFEVFQVLDGVVHVRTVEWDQERIEGAETKLVEELVDGKPFVRPVKVVAWKRRPQTVLRPVPEADATFKTAGGDLLTYKQAAAKLTGGAACLAIDSDDPVDPLILKALKPDTIIVRWTAKADGRGVR